MGERGGRGWRAGEVRPMNTIHDALLTIMVRLASSCISAATFRSSCYTGSACDRKSKAISHEQEVMTSQPKCLPHKPVSFSALLVS